MREDARHAIVTESLTRRFGSLLAVNALSIAVPASTIFGLLGPNGAGKSTTIKMLTTLLPPSAGRAFVAGADIVREPAHVRASIGYVPQMLSADSDLTGYENLLISAKLYRIAAGERRTRIDRALAFMGLTEAAHTRVRAYSGGMIRQLELAQAMLHVDALRTLMIQGGASTYGLRADFAVLAAILAVLVAVASRLYPSLAA